MAYINSNTLTESQLVTLVDDNGTPVNDVVPSIVTTEIDHYIIHKGRSFIYSDVLMATSGGGTRDILLVNTTADEIHLKDFTFTSTQGEAEVFLYFDVTTDDLGTPITFKRKNRNSPNTPTITAGLDPTNPVFNESHTQHFLLVGGKKSGGLAESGVEEYVMKQNEKCVLRYINNSVGTNDNFNVTVTTLDVGLL